MTGRLCVSQGYDNVRDRLLELGFEIKERRPVTALAKWASARHQPQWFTGQERDGESGLDYFWARFFIGGLGRFTSPDAPFVDQTAGDPQSWNLYSYGRNNPLVNTDPSGRWSQGPNGRMHDDEAGKCADVTSVTITDALQLAAQLVMSCVVDSPRIGR